MTTTTWKTDPTHTDIQFAAKHMMVTTIHGKFTTIEGTVTLDEANPASSFGSFTVDAASINSGVERRDGHLRSADFFDVETHPTIAFASTTVVARDGNHYAVTGDLTIRGITRPVTFDVEFLGLYAGFEGRRAGLTATTTLNREDWGLTWNMGLEAGGWLVGKEIKLELDIALDEVAPAPVEDEVVAASA
ncbi:MAG: YceI family protein [Candidatus Limnocylindrales bacterium]